MSVYVDKLKFRSKARNNRDFGNYAHIWCHLWADTVEELQRFVALLEIKGKLWPASADPNEHFKLPHLQILGRTRKRAIAAGAIDMWPKSVYAPVTKPVRPVKPVARKRVVAEQFVLPMFMPVGKP